MQRIICDSYAKQEKQLWNIDKDDPRNQEFNQRILAVNNMYGWLYEQGILRNISFEMKDYPDVVYFAFDAQDLIPYREAMERSGVKDADLAAMHIFDAEYMPCCYSGAIELSWSMMTYRDVDGCVSSSWECDLIRHLDSATVQAVWRVLEDKGVKEAVHAAFEFSGFEPDLFEQAFNHFKALDLNMKDHRDYLEGHADKLIYCFQNNMVVDLMDIDCWVRLEDILDESLTFEEYRAVNAALDVDPHDIEKTDSEAISALKDVLCAHRDKNKPLKANMDNIVLDFGNIVSELETKNLKLLKVKDNNGLFVVDREGNLYGIETYYHGGYLDRFIGEKFVISFERMEQPTRDFEDWRKEFMDASWVKSFIERVVEIEYPNFLKASLSEQIKSASNRSVELHFSDKSPVRESSPER